MVCTSARAIDLVGCVNIELPRCERRNLSACYRYAYIWRNRLRAIVLEVLEARPIMAI